MIHSKLDNKLVQMFPQSNTFYVFSTLSKHLNSSGSKPWSPREFYFSIRHNFENQLAYLPAQFLCMLSQVMYKFIRKVTVDQCLEVLISVAFLTSKVVFITGSEHSLDFYFKLKKRQFVKLYKYIAHVNGCM